MNIIKGLITKDILQLRSYRRSLVIFFVVFVFMGLQQDTVGTLPIMMALAFGMFSIASFNYDEMSKTDRYILSLPVTRKEVVISKYVMSIIATIIGAIIGIVISIIIILLFQKISFDLTELITLGFGGVFGIALMQSFQIPLIYKFGVEKGRMYAIIVVIVLGALVGGGIYAGKDVVLSESLSFSILIPVVLSILTAICYYISYKIAYKIYQKKEV